MPFVPLPHFALFSVYYRFRSKEYEATDPTLRCMRSTEQSPIDAWLSFASKPVAPDFVQRRRLQSPNGRDLCGSLEIWYGSLIAVRCTTNNLEISRRITRLTPLRLSYSSLHFCKAGGSP